MTPKEKAEELVNIYTEVIYPIINIEKAKQCALIAVDEIFKLQSIDSYDWHFYKEVKQEIEQL